MPLTKGLGVQVQGRTCLLQPAFSASLTFADTEGPAQGSLFLEAVGNLPVFLRPKDLLLPDARGSVPEGRASLRLFSAHWTPRLITRPLADWWQDLCAKIIQNFRTAGVGLSAWVRSPV